MTDLNTLFGAEFITNVVKKIGFSGDCKIQPIQNLWSGYGQLCRVCVGKYSLILKLVNPPDQISHPRGWATSTGHRRKLKSYEVESHWYEHYADRAKDLHVPKFLGSGCYEGVRFLALEDLRQRGYKTLVKVDFHKIIKCVRWLAKFHRTFLQQKPTDLWKEGTYWHLATRKEELENTGDISVKQIAEDINARLENAQVKTIVHGDAKLANFMFSQGTVSAVDFQYVGGGVGVKDLAYFLSSVFKSSELFRHEREILDLYFQALSVPDVEREWRALYPFAWADFYRFLAGWSPGHWKMHAYSETMFQNVHDILSAEKC